MSTESFTSPGMTLREFGITAISPTVETAHEIADTLLAAFNAPADEGGVSELHIVYTRFSSMVSQAPRVLRMIPLEVVEEIVLLMLVLESAYGLERVV